LSRLLTRAATNAPRRRPITARCTAVGLLPLLRQEFRLLKLILHSELRRRAASRRALPCPSSSYYNRLCFAYTGAACLIFFFIIFSYIHHYAHYICVWCARIMHTLLVCDIGLSTPLMPSSALMLLMNIFLSICLTWKSMADWPLG